MPVEAGHLDSSRNTRSMTFVRERGPSHAYEVDNARFVNAHSARPRVEILTASYKLIAERR